MAIDHGDFKDRLVVEARDLKLKIEALDAFMGGRQFEALNRRNREELVEQWRYMQDYLRILKVRACSLGVWHISRYERSKKIENHELKIGM